MAVQLKVKLIVMNRLPYLKSPKDSAQQGFTLVELITVILLLGIVSIVIVPRFSGTSGFAEYAMQKRVVSAMRNIQLKAMNDTRSGYCYRMIFDLDSTNPQFGPSTANYLSGQQAASCATSIDNSSEAFMRSQVNEIAQEGLILNALDGANSISFIQFDNMGRPSTNVSNCASTCRISLTGESTAAICVESEGYVYAC